MSLTADSIEVLEEKVQQGDTEAMFTLGVRCIEGIGMTPDYPRGVSLLQGAVDLGDTAAMNDLGVIYEEGVFAPQDGRTEQSERPVP